MTYRTLENVYRMMHEKKDHHSTPLTPVVDAEDKTVETPEDKEPENKKTEDTDCSAKIAARLKALKAQYKTKIIDNA